MTKPIGPICNLDCRYCFYLEKEAMYVQEGRRTQPSWRMSDEVLESYIRQYIQQQDVPDITFAWQGGEPTLLGVEFFRKVVALQAKHADGRRIHNALQTNATLLDDAWGEFLAEQRFLVGVSLDGPADLHDAYRVDKQGRPSFERVMQGMGVLKTARSGLQHADGGEPGQLGASPARLPVPQGDRLDVPAVHPAGGARRARPAGDGAGLIQLASPHRPVWGRPTLPSRTGPCGPTTGGRS